MRDILGTSITYAAWNQRELEVTSLMLYRRYLCTTCDLPASRDRGLLAPRQSSAAAESLLDSLEDLPLLQVELLEEPPIAQVERASRTAIGRLPRLAAVEAPASGSRLDRAAQVREEVLGPWLPAAKTAAERLVIE